MLFDEKLDMQLLKLVKSLPALYDPGDEQYMNFDAREVAWHKIGDELKRAAGDCKARWINIRDTNRRILRKRIKNPKLRIRQYKYDKDLMFMRPFYRDILSQNPEFGLNENSSNNEDGPNDAKSNSDNSYYNEPIIKKEKKGRVKKSYLRKRKIKKVQEEIELPETSNSFKDTSTAQEFDSSDPVDAFLLSIGATLKTFSAYHLNLAKSQIFTVVQEHDLQQIVQKNNNSERNSSSETDS